MKEIPVDERVDSPKMVKFLLKQGLNPNSIMRGLHEGEDGYTIWEIALHGFISWLELPQSTNLKRCTIGL